MTQGKPQETDPLQLVQQRLSELGAARAHVSDAVARLPLLDLTRQSLDYEHQVGGLNAQLVISVVDNLVDVQSELVDVGMYHQHEAHYVRYAKGIKNRIVTDDPVIAVQARSQVMWFGQDAGDIQGVTSPVVVERQDPDAYGNERDDIRVKIELDKGGYQTSHMPLFVVGERIGDEGLSAIVLARPTLTTDYLTIAGQLFSSHINTTQYALLQEQAETLVPTPADIQALYKPTRKAYVVAAGTPGAQFAQPPERKVLSGEYKPLDATGKARKVRELPLRIEVPQPVGAIGTDDFEAYGVLEHLVDLAGAFGKTDMLSDQLAARQAAMPRNPIDGFVTSPKDPHAAEYASLLPGVTDKIFDMRGRNPGV